jgi:hypothetical protein
MLRICGRAPLAVVLVVVPMLSGCAAGGPQAFTQSGRVGPDDGSDACHAQAVALDETGDFFGLGAVGGAILGGIAGGNLKSALIGAAAGGAVGAAGGYWQALQQQNQNTEQLESTVEGNLSAENAQINKTQIAFNNDMDCRFEQAAQIKAAYKAGTITEDQAAAELSAQKTLAQRDLQLAQTINGQIQSRGAQFDTAADNLDGQTAPGPSVSALSKPAVMRHDEPLLLRPDADAPEVGSVARHEDVTVTGVSGDYALVQTADGTSGYAPLAYVREAHTYRAIVVPPSEQIPPPEPEEAAASSGDANAAYVPPSAGSAPATGAGSAAPTPPPSTTAVQQLDGSNAASRDSFAQNVAVSQSAVSNGFQLAT